MSINCKRLIDCLIEEHLSKGGRENGSLIATYDQLVAAGIARRLIHRTISEAEALGLTRVERGGRKGFVNHLSTFTLTFLPTHSKGGSKDYWRSPTDDWRSITLNEIVTFQRNNGIKSWLRYDTNTVPQHSNLQLQHAQS
jgi:hypothetical protein